MQNYIILDRLAKSKFRSRFKFRAKELEYIKDKGQDKIKSHAEDFIRDRVAPAEPVNKGKQTPMRGHPVFIVQHATATCCRGCIEKWHKLTQHCQLTPSEQEYIVSVIMEWIKRQINSSSVL
jgi:exodeoxyribonuclease V alpha subunit